MKTDISIPNPVFRAAEKLAKKMGISLSDLYTVALTSYVVEYEKDDVTEALDRVYAHEPSKLEPEIIKVQVAVLEPKQW